MRGIAIGKIRSFDQADRSIAFEDGMSFNLAPTVDMTVIRTGDFVSVEYDEVGEVDGPPSDQQAPSDKQRHVKIADSVLKTSPNDPRWADPKNPNLLTRPAPLARQPTPPPKSTVNTTTSLKSKS